jgi:membrane protease YdiL (CAAX protease family)
VICVLLVTGTTRREAYLVVGDLGAAAGSPRSGRRPWRWNVVGPVACLGLLLLTAWLTAPMLPQRIDFGAALPFLAIGVLAAVLNAFWEEIAYRAAPLSQLQRAVGPSFGVVILAVWFGLGHFYGGIPSGPVGAVAAAAVALLFGRAMIETRGLGWPLALHFSSDVAIYSVLALASVA